MSKHFTLSKIHLKPTILTNFLRVGIYLSFIMHVLYLEFLLGIFAVLVTKVAGKIGVTGFRHLRGDYLKSGALSKVHSKR